MWGAVYSKHIIVNVFLFYNKGVLQVEKLQIHIVNDYSGSMVKKQEDNIFDSMVGFRVNNMQPYIDDVLEPSFDVVLKYYYLGMGKVKTFNKKGDPVRNDNAKYKTMRNCGGLGNILLNLKKIYKGIKKSKAIVIVLSDNVWVATPTEIEEFYQDFQLDPEFLLFNVNLNQKVQLKDNILFSNVVPSHINLTDPGMEEVFMNKINQFLKI